MQLALGIFSPKILLATRSRAVESSRTASDAMQQQLRREKYGVLRDEVAKGTEPDRIGKRVIDPATRTGSDRDQGARYYDAMAICGDISQLNVPRPGSLQVHVLGSSCST